jgi:mono/diheme cytochrome c family protein
MASFADDPELDASTDRWMRWGLVLMGFLVLAFPLYRLTEPSARDDARERQLAALAGDGQALFQQNCASCHGADGEGASGPALNSEQFLSAATDAQIRNLVSVGVPGTTMAAWSQDFAGSLTSEQIRAVTAYLRSWEDTAPDRPDWRVCCTAP